MDYKYLAKNHISEQQTIIVRDYFETPLETHGNHLDHITHICQYYNISAPLLRIMVSHFKIYDTQTHCRECNIMRQIYEPNYNYQNQKFNLNRPGIVGDPKLWDNTLMKTKQYSTEIKTRAVELLIESQKDYPSL